MYFDGYTDVGSSSSEDRVLGSGPKFPFTFRIGELFRHDTHGLCVFCHDAKWRKVIEQ